MPKCCICEAIVENGLLFGFWGIKEETRPICITCLKKILDSNGKNMGLGIRIERWLHEEKYAFSKINEPDNLFHYILKDIGPLKVPIEIFQEKNKSELMVGFMTFLSKELTFKLYKFSKARKQEFKNKVDEFLSTLQTDYRTGLTVSYEIISDKGSYGAKYFVKSKSNSCDKKILITMIEMVKDTSIKSDKFLNRGILN